MNRLAIIIPAVASVVIASCAVTPSEPRPSETPPETSTPQPAQDNAPGKPGTEAAPGAGAGAESTGGQSTRALPTPPEVMFHVFAGELAGKHQNYAAAARHYLKAARISRDPAIARRAVRIAMFANDHKRALEAVTRLLELAPDNARAHRTAARLALKQKDWDGARAHLERMLALSTRSAMETWQRVAALLSLSGDEAKSLAVMAALVGDHPDVWQAHYAYSMLASHYLETEVAVAQASRALALNPDWGRGYNWRGRLLLSTQDYEAAARDFKKALALHPERKKARYHYAEVLRRMERYDQAQAVLKALPESAGLLRTRAVLAIEAKDWPLAEQLYRQMLTLDGYDPEARFFLGQLAEMRDRPEDALRWYRLVDGGKYEFQSRIRRAVVLNELGRLEDALAVLDHVIAEGGEWAVDARLAKAQLLAEHDRVTDAFSVYDQGLAKNPGNTRLLYGRAILAAENDMVQRAERDFRKILEQKPNDAMTLNALGFTLADATTRYQEALDLIKQALEIKPHSAAIIDSLGWVHYRMGDYKLAEKKLRRALELKFDPQVAAHLVEVLWVTGQKDAARKVWHDALEKAPEESDVLEKTMERLTS